MKKWIQITKGNREVLAYDKKNTDKHMKMKFKKMVNQSKYTFVKWIDDQSQPYRCLIKSENDEIIDVALYLYNIINAGWSDKKNKKRIEIRKNEIDEYKMYRFANRKQIDLILGYYNYSKPIFTYWNPKDYMSHNTVCSCYVDSKSLIEGYINGKVKITNRNNKESYVFCVEKFGEVFDELLSLIPEKQIQRDTTRDTTDIKNASKEIIKGIVENEYFKNFYWDAKEVIKTEIKEERKRKNKENSYWKQMEWIGFHFESKAKKVLQKKINTSGVRYGKSSIDCFSVIPWDFKTHCLDTDKEEKILQIPVLTNDWNAIVNAVRDYRYIGFIILEGKATYDVNGEFKKWHDKLKKVKEEEGQSNKRSRIRKVDFSFKRIRVIYLDEKDLKLQGDFQEKWLNTSDVPRNKKMEVNLNTLDPTKWLIYDFQNEKLYDYGQYNKYKEDNC